MLDLQKCEHCGTLTYHVYVHGHYQCNHCKVNTDPCCSGEQNQNKEDSPRLSLKQKEQWRGYVSTKLQSKLRRQATEKGLTDSQADKYINTTLKKVERRLNRRKSG